MGKPEGCVLWPSSRSLDKNERDNRACSASIESSARLARDLSNSSNSVMRFCNCAILMSFSLGIVTGDTTGDRIVTRWWCWWWGVLVDVDAAPFLRRNTGDGDGDNCWGDSIKVTRFLFRRGLIGEEEGDESTSGGPSKEGEENSWGSWGCDDAALAAEERVLIGGSWLDCLFLGGRPGPRLPKVI